MDEEVDDAGRMRMEVEFPEEIVVDILIRLPVKALLTFKAVSKSWYSIINSTEFVKKHLNYARVTRYNQHKNFLGITIPSRNALNPCVLYKENSDGTVRAKEFDFPYQLPDGPCKEFTVIVLNYCDGLICFDMCSRGILVWNPSLPLEYKVVQHPHSNVGFPLMGYDPSTDDYKIVCIPSSATNDIFPRRYFFVEVYSMKRKSWWKKKISNFFIYEVCQLKGIYTRNRLHWIGRALDDNQTQLIVYFDLVEERLDYVNLPAESYMDWTLLIYKESFAVLRPNSEGHEELWVLQDYCGMRSSWNKIFKIESVDVGFYLDSCFTGNGDILDNTGELGLRTFDVNRGSYKDVVIQGDAITIKDEHLDSLYASPYVESLVSPRWMDRVERDKDEEALVEVVELLEEIAIEILLRLPVKSLLKFKAVCKSWYAIISDTLFIKKHLNHAHATRYNQHQNFLFLYIPDHDASNCCALLKDNSDDIVHAQRLNFPYRLPAGPYSFFGEIPVEVCNYCDGLICFNLFSHGILLWNPSLPVEYKMIKHPNASNEFTLMGYDPNTDDYKIVTIASTATNDISTGRYFCVEIYSMKSKSWRKKKMSNFFMYKISQPKGIYTRNRLHWVGTGLAEDNKTDLIIYFDLVEERLDYVNLPAKSYNDWILLIYKESFGILGKNSKGHHELWILQDYCGLKSLWKKIFQIETVDVGFHFHSCFTRNGEILIDVRTVGVRTYDVSSGNIKDAPVQGDAIHIPNEEEDDQLFYASPYVESLVSPRWWQ